MCAEEGKLELPMVLAFECKNPQVFFCKTKTSKATKAVFKTTNHLPHILCVPYTHRMALDTPRSSSFSFFFFVLDLFERFFFCLRS